MIEWVVQYIRNKDILAKQIVSVDLDKEGVDVYVELKSGLHVVVVEPFVSDMDSVLARLEPFKGKGKLTIVVFNNKENLDKIVGVWNGLVEFDPKLMLIFANPFSRTDKRWIVFPRVHHKVSEQGSLERGLMTLAENVELIDEAEIKRILKKQ